MTKNTFLFLLLTTLLLTLLNLTVGAGIPWVWVLLPLWIFPAFIGAIITIGALVWVVICLLAFLILVIK